MLVTVTSLLAVGYLHQVAVTHIVAVEDIQDD